MSRWQRGCQIASVVIALVLAGSMIAGSAIEYRRFLICHARKEDCDMLIVALWPILMLVAAALIAASTVAILRRAVWPLVVVWALLCTVPLGLDVYLLVPGVRQSWAGLK